MNLNSYMSVKLITGAGCVRASAKELAKLGITPTYGAPLLAVLNPQVYALMINHVHRPGISAKGVTQATLEAREELHRIVDALRSSGGIWKNVRIAATADAIGVREGRRIRGLYTVTAEDERPIRFCVGVVLIENILIDAHCLIKFIISSEMACTVIQAFNFIIVKIG